jgi:hypothetical protein
VKPGAHKAALGGGENLIPAIGLKLGAGAGHGKDRLWLVQRNNRE